MTVPNKKLKLSYVMGLCLRDIHDHGDAFHSCRGQPEHHGRCGTIVALQRRGLVRRDKSLLVLTDEGKAIASPPQSNSEPKSNDHP